MKKSNSGTFIAIAVIISIGCFLAAWQMIIPKLKTDQAALNAAKAEIASAQEKLDSLKTAQSSLAELGVLVDQLFVAVPGDTDTPNLLAELEAIANKNQTFIPSIEFDSGQSSASSLTAGTTGNNIAITFSVQGSYANLKNFLSAIERDLRFMNIKTYSFSAAEDEGQMTLALGLEAYKRQDNSLSGSAAEPVSDSTSTGSVKASE